MLRDVDATDEIILDKSTKVNIDARRREQKLKKDIKEKKCGGVVQK